MSLWLVELVVVFFFFCEAGNWKLFSYIQLDLPLRHTQVYHPLCLAIPDYGEFALDFFRMSGDLT